MKKIILIVLCAAFALMATACSTNESSFLLLEKKPWQFSQAADNIESLKMSAQRFSIDGNERTALADGTLTFSLVENKTAANTAVLSANMSLTYNGNSLYEGKTDTLASEVFFSTAMLSPIKSKKTLTLNAREKKNGYSVETDYETKKSTIIYENGDTESLSLKGSGFIDNEQLYYIIRAAQSFAAGASFSFEIVTPFDMFAANKYFRHKINVKISAEAQPIEVNKTIYDIAAARADGSGKLNDGGVYSIDCLVAEVSIDSAKSGPPFFIYFSDINFNDNPLSPLINTTRVPVKIVVNEKNLDGSISYTNEYNLIDYSTAKSF